MSHLFLLCQLLPCPPIRSLHLSTSRMPGWSLCNASSSTWVLCLELCSGFSLLLRRVPIPNSCVWLMTVLWPLRPLLPPSHAAPQSLWLKRLTHPGIVWVPKSCHTPSSKPLHVVFCLNCPPLCHSIFLPGELLLILQVLTEISPLYLGSLPCA